MTKEHPHFFCPSCNQVTEHSIVNEKDKDITVKCLLCGMIHKAETDPEPETIPINVIITIGQKTIKETQYFDKKERLLVGGFMRTLKTDNGEEQLLTITSIEANGRRVDNAKPENINFIWAEANRHVKLTVFILDGIKTIPLLMASPADLYFGIGQIRELGQRKFKITQIELKNGKMMTNHGSLAKDIKSIFGMKA